MSLLIVDRDHSCRHELVRSFQVQQRSTLAVGTCMDALRILQQRQVSAVLVAVCGPDPFALTILRWCALLGLNAPTIVLLGRGAGYQAEVLRRCGASAVRRWPSELREVALALAVAEGIAKLRLYEHVCDGVAAEGASVRREPPRNLPDGASPKHDPLAFIDLLGCCAAAASVTRGLLKRTARRLPVWQRN